MANNEGALREAIARAVGRRDGLVPLDLRDFAGWARQPRVSQVDSTNHGALGLLGDLVNLANSRPTFLPRDAQEEKSRLYAGGPLLDREAMTRAEYTTWGLDALLGGRELWPELGEPEIAELCRVHILAAFAFLALGAVDVNACVFDPREADRDGPGCFTADRPATRQTRGKPSLSTCGARSSNNKVAGTSGRKPPKGAPTPWRNWIPAPVIDLFDDAIRCRLDDVGSALAKRGRDGRWVTKEEADILKGAMNDEPQATRIALGWLRRCPPDKPFRIIRRTLGVSTLNLKGKASSTANLDATAVFRTGVHKFLCANAGGRENPSGNDTVGSTTTTVSDDGRIASAIRDDRGAGPDAVVMALPGGDTLLDVEFGDGRWLERVAPLPEVPPTEDPNEETHDEPGPRPEKPSLLDRLRAWWRRLRERGR